MPAKRLLLIDYLKGIAILMMVGLHYVFVMTLQGWLDAGVTRMPAYIVLSRMVALTFITLSTVVLWYRSQQTVITRQWFGNVARQVAKLAAAALVVTLATRWWLPDMYVRFGMLHLLAAATLINGLLFRLPLPRSWFVFFGSIVVMLGWILSAVALPASGLLWLGFVPPDFGSIDFVPLLPWLGYTWWAAAASPLLIRTAQWSQPLLEQQAWRWLQACGRHSLMIYLLHIPLVLTLLTVGQWLF